MMKTNRRFPFERSKELNSLEYFSTTERQLYPIIRQYASICRPNNHEKSRHVQQEIVPTQDNDRLNQLLNHLKQDRKETFLNFDDFSILREDNLQRWKHVRYEWQQYYREEIPKINKRYLIILWVPLDKRWDESLQINKTFLSQKMIHCEKAINTD